MYNLCLLLPTARPANAPTSRLNEPVMRVAAAGARLFQALGIAPHSENVRAALRFLEPEGATAATFAADRAELS